MPAYERGAYPDSAKSTAGYSRSIVKEVQSVLQYSRSILKEAQSIFDRAFRIIKYSRRTLK
jgi:hypothetical protein